MNIRAEVVAFLNVFTADVEFSQTAMSFFGPSWEIGLFLGLIPIRGKTKELMKIEYEKIAEIKVGKNTRPFNKKDACLLKMKNGQQIELAFVPFESGRTMLYEHAGNLFSE